jgi:ATP-dependent DNA ligase
MLHEPKLDGFRCVVFRDGDEVELGSRNERPMTRDSPELVQVARRELPRRCVVDGEVVVASGAGLDFEALLQRIHPADSRVRLLAAETPALLIAFDLLSLDDRSLLQRPFAERRAALEAALAGAGAPVHTTPVTGSLRGAQRRFRTLEGAGLDGVVAKPPDLPYRED